MLNKNSCLPTVRPTRIAVALIAAFALSACGGGGGSKGGTRADDAGPGVPTAPVSPGHPDTETPPDNGSQTGGAEGVADAASFDTAEYRRGNFLARIGAAEAYAAGANVPASGAGVTVAVIDTGVAVDHPELSGAIAPGGRMFGYGNAGHEVFDADGHGTAVAGIIGARRNEIGMHGVAWGANILPIGSAPVALPESTYGDMFAHAHAMGARVINNSWTMALDIDAFGSRQQLEAFLPTSARALTRFADEGGVVVFAAGNEGAPQPQFWARLPEKLPELRDNWVAVVAIDSSGHLAGYSNACGTTVTANWCIAAPGGDGIAPIVSLHPDGAPAGVIGTSMAAPVVSGAIAVLMELFPSLGGDQIVQRLFVTADRSGHYALSHLYGQGLLDLAAAARPVGGLLLPLGATVDGPTVALGSARLTVPAAQLASLRTALADEEVVVVDAFQRAPFRVSAASLLSGDSGGHETLDARVQRRHGRTPGAEALALVEVGSAALAGDGSSQVNLIVGAGATSGALDRAHGLASWSAFAFDALTPRDSGVGLVPGIGFAVSQGDWRLSAYGQRGAERAGRDGTAFATRVSRHFDGFTLALGFDQTGYLEQGRQTVSRESDARAMHIAAHWQAGAQWEGVAALRLQHQRERSQLGGSVQGVHERVDTRLALGASRRSADGRYLVSALYRAELDGEGKVRVNLPVSVAADGTLSRRTVHANAPQRFEHGLGVYFGAVLGAARSDQINLAANWHTRDGGELTLGWQRWF